MSAPTAYPIIEDYFELVLTNPSILLYQCILCGQKSFRNYQDHAQGTNHQSEVVKFLTQQAELDKLNPAMTSPELGTGAVEGMEWTHNLDFDQDLGVPLPEKTNSPEDMTTRPNIWDQDNSGLFEKQKNVNCDDESLAENQDFIYEGLCNILDSEEKDDEPEQVQEEEIVYEDEQLQDDGNHTDEWFPFKKKEVHILFNLVVYIS
ncbi:hypothetical protein CROQUDRAFT_54047 [Cronartium quercuum f. sp. fusiforme G11]|uniref:Uncharacterized protein n=1 Tax=Cronartium quercuum f. sp. fusiforme G11 TaxID=708437 RepID=A0A9P6N5U3_9BASI|nr:hypothetical protein CROQUDRAFT_54047 [Cronartium quercuum f. sp. fusiforme G11]